MTVYQKTLANLGVKLEITHASPDIANNRTTITYKASVYKTGSHNPWNALSETPMYLTINGQSLYSTSSGNYNLSGSTYEQTIKSGTLVIPHNSDGSKSFSFSWNVNFTSTGYGYGNVTTSGTYVLPSIGRRSTFTIPSTTITTGSAFTVSISRASSSFTHRVSYIVGNNETRWTSNATTSYAATVPHSLFNAHKSTDSVSGVIRVTTMNGSSVVGSSQRSVTIKLNSAAIPKVGSLSASNSNTSVFSNSNQYLRGVSRLTATAGSVSGSYSSTIASYEFRVVRSNGTTIFGAASKTTSSHQFPAFDFPNSSSEVVTPQVRVRDSRGRYSAWRAASAIRVHYYAPPTIGTMTVRRVGSANTTLQVTRNYSITLLYQGGSGSNLNTASLRFQHRTKGTTTATNNTGAKSTTTSLSNSNANLSGTFATGVSYEVRAILSDKINTVYGSWVSVGTEFVPMDIGPKGVGVGKVHSNGGVNLEVGSGGISSEGRLRAPTFDIIDNRSLNPSPYASGSSNRGLSVHFKNTSTIGVPGGSTYSTLFDIQPWNDQSGGNHQQIAINGQGDVYGRMGTSSWTGWRKFIKENSNGTVTIDGVGSTITIGSYNSGWSHFESSGSPFHFNKQVSVAGHVYAANASGNGYASRLARVDELPSSATNSNGRRIRYNNGVQICQGSIEFDTVSAGTLTFTSPFVGDPPVVTMTIQQPERWKFVSSSVTAVTLRNFTFNATNYDAIALTGKFKVNYIAYGRWV